MGEREKCLKDMMKLISWMTSQRFPLRKLLSFDSVLGFSHSNHSSNFRAWWRYFRRKGILYCHKIILHNINPLQIWILEEEEIVSLNYNTELEKKTFEPVGSSGRAKSWRAFANENGNFRFIWRREQGGEKNGNDANLIFNIQFPFISIFISTRLGSLVKWKKNYFLGASNFLFAPHLIPLGNACEISCENLCHK